MEPLEITHFTDPGCPWAYSAEPALTTLRYRFGDGIRIRRVMIGLAENASVYDARGYQPANSAAGRTMFRNRFGMPYSFQARSRNQGTALACRAVKAAEAQGDLLAEATLRAMRFGFFCSVDLMDEDEGVRAWAATVDGLDVERLLADLHSAAVIAAYEGDRAETRNAAVTGMPAIAQDKTANYDGAVRFTAPSLLFSRGDRTLVAGGWQSTAVYDVCIANLAPELERRAPGTPAEVLPRFPYGLTTQEVAEACTGSLAAVDRDAATRELVALEARGAARYVPLGDDALWLPR
jgi:predicted DsbA family dithiol-disulfide isomerase